VSESIGSAELEVGVDLAPLDAGLAKAEKKVAIAAAAMQKMLDRHVDVSGDKLGALGAGLDSQMTRSLGGLRKMVSDTTAGVVASWAEQRAAQDAIAASIERTAAVAVAASEVEIAASHRVTAAYLEQAAAARAAAGAGGDALGGSLGADAVALAASRGGGGRGGGGGLSPAEMALLSSLGGEGVRGKAHWGSRTNPMVVVLEAGSRTSLGSLAAAVAENSASGAGSSSPTGPLAVSTAAQAVREAASGPKTAAGASNTDQRNRALQDAALATAIDKLDQLAGARPTTAPTKAQPSADATDALWAALAAKGARGGGMGALSVPGRAGGRAEAVPVAITDEAPAVRAGAAQALVDAMAAKGRTGSELGGGQWASAALQDYYNAKGFTAAMAPDSRLRLYGTGGQAGTSNYGLSPAALAAAGAGRGGSGGGGGGFPPWLTALLWGHAGGGGGGGRRLPGYAGALLGGAAGIGAGFGSLGSFAGFGPEHIILTLGGIAGSGVAALGGGALLGAGAAGKLGVGAGSDAAVLASTVADTKQLYSAYEKLNRAQQTYGKGSEQAKEAAKELNLVLNELGHTAGVKAEEGVAKAAMSVNEFWDKQTSGARVQASKVLMQLLELDRAYIPLVAHAAEQNFAIINSKIKPLIGWLKGPEGMGIFLELEREFKDEIPTAMAALDQGVQFFGKTIAYTAPMTGRFLDDLDRFFTKWNSPGEFSVWEGEMQKLIQDFHVWGAFVKILGDDLVDLFDKDAHTGESIIELLTHMLVKLHEYENSAAGSAAIRNIFTVHKEEVLQLLQVLIPLISSFSHIYTTVAPPLVRAVTEVARGFDWLLETIEKGGKLEEWVIGLGLIAWKLKLLVPLLKAAGVETGILTGEEGKNAGAGAIDAAAQGGLAGTTAVEGGSAYERALGAQEGSDALAGEGLLAGGGGLLTKSTLLKGGIYGVGGLLGGSLLAGAVGAKGTLGNAISGAGGGAGVGFVAGGAITGSILGTEITPVVGTAIGAVLGAATPLAVKFLEQVFATHAPSYGKKLAEGILGPQSALGASKLYQPGIEGALNAAHRASKPTGLSGGLANALTVAGTVGSGPFAPVVEPILHAVLGGSGPNRAAQAKDEKTAGERVAKAFVAGFQEVRFPTKSVLLAQMQETLDKTPVGAARNAAAKAMIAYAQELEAKGALPKGAVTEVIRGLEAQFPHLGAYLKQQGQSMASQFATALKLKEARTQLTESLDKISQLFGTSNADTITNAMHTMTQLAFVISHSKGPLKTAAEEAFGELSSVVSANFEAAKKAVAEQTAGINQQLEGEFKALGMPTKISVGKEGLVLSHPNPITGTPFGKAQGGLIQIGRPGEGGRDTVGLNVGGLPIAVGAGEQVAVFNRHQLPVVNAALAPVGGLAGLFDQVSTPNYMASGGIVAPHTGGSGAIPLLVRDSLSRVTHAANRRLGSVQGTGLGSHRGGYGGHASAGGQYDRSQLEALWVAAGGPRSLARTAAAIALAESGGNAGAVNPEGPEHAEGLWQIKGQLVPGNPLNPMVSARNAVAKWRAAGGFSPWVTYTSGAFDAYMARGGILGFAAGGLVPVHPGGRPQPVTRGYGSRARRNPRGARGKLGRLGGTIPGLKWPSAVNALEGLIDTKIPISQEGYEGLGNRFSLREYGSGELSFIATEGPLGEQITPYEDVPNVEGRLQQLQELVGAESNYKVLLESARSKLNHLGVWIAAAIKYREKRVKELQEKIAHTRHQIEVNLARIESISEHISKVEQHIHSLEYPAHGKPDRHAIGVAEGQVSKLEKTRKGLEDQNKALGGSPTSIGSGGKLGPWESKREAWKTQLSGLREHRSTWSEDLKAIQGTGGSGGTLGEARLTIEQLGKQMEELSPGTLGKALAKAKAQTGPSASEQELTSLLQEKNLELARELAVSQAQYKVFQGWTGMSTGGVLNPFGALPFAGHFATGGLIPGALGSPKAAVVHGGEEVLTAGQRKPSIQVIVQDGAVNTNRIAVIADGVVQKRTRKMSRGPSRPLPSQGGGLIV
jgi:hypothetical protein